MRKTCLDMVYELAKQDERIFFIGSDLGVGVLKQFREEMPGRFLMEGVSEANVIGIAAGLALEGKIPYINTIATFLTRRCFEQVVLDLCLHHVKVRLIGSGGGLVYAPLGPTHLAVEDLAILRAVPEMTIVAPADAEEMRRLMPHTVDHPGPLYIRLAKGYDPVVSRADLPFEIGKAILMREGADALLVTTGVCLQLCLAAAEQLAAQGIEASVLHIHTVKPLDIGTLRECIDTAPVVVAVEEHSVIGGLGSAIAEVIAEADLTVPRRFRRVGLPDRFADRYGSQYSLMAHLGITAERVFTLVQQLHCPRTASQPRG
jgi:transketolase